MIYFVNPIKLAVPHMLAGTLGYIDTPLQGNKRPGNVKWCADNGCFNDATFNEDRWWSWLTKHAVDADSCRFATAPDVIGSHADTMVRSGPWLAKIRDLGYPAAFVAQDGATVDNVPWERFDAIFIGGSTEFKLSEQSRELVAAAVEQGKHAHMGRVNSRKRLRLAHSWGCHSVDGTYLVFGPSINLPKLLGWLEELPVTTSPQTGSDKTLVGWLDEVPLSPTAQHEETS